MTNTPEISVIVPAYREAANLRELTERLFSALATVPLTAELIVVDDNSGDGTVELCQELAAQYPVRLITRNSERGLATAVICGLREARGILLVVMDADLSHPPESVPALLEPLSDGNADFVIGSRYVKGGSVDQKWSPARRLNSRIATLLAAGLTRVHDPMAGFFALRKYSLARVSDLKPCGYKIGLELLVRCGCTNVTEIPIHFEDRKRGESKLSPREQWLYVRHLCRLYDFRYPELLRFACFGAVGVSGMMVDLLCFWCLLPLLGLAIGRGMAIWIAMTWNFEWNRRITFREPTGSSPIVEYLRFCTACLLGAGMSWTTSLALLTWTNPFHGNPVTAAIIGTAVASVANFVFCRLWVFGRRQPRQIAAEPSGCGSRTRCTSF